MGKVLHCGMPRNDFLVNGETDRARKNVEEGVAFLQKRKFYCMRLHIGKMKHTKSLT